MSSLSPGNRRSLGVVVPVYRPRQDRCISYIEMLLEELDVDELVVSIDCPPEGFVEELPEKVITDVSNTRRGKGKAIEDGFNRLETDLLMFVDGDGSVGLNAVKKIAGTESDLVVGSRRHSGGSEAHHESLVRKRLGDVLVLLARLSIGNRLHDYQCGAKMFRKEVWDDIRDSIGAGGFSWDLEVIYQVESRGYRIEEVPVDWDDRPESTVSIPRDVFLFLKTLGGIILERVF